MANPPSTDLAHLLANMTPVLVPGRYVFLTIPAGTTAPNIPCIGSFQESEGTTIICVARDAKALNLPTSVPFGMITLQVASSLNAVGFLAQISAALAAQNIPCNVVSAFHHDHLVIPEDLTEAALIVLIQLSQRSVT